MSQRPALTGKQLLDALHRLGFETVRIKGSHHSGETIGPGLLSVILRQTELTRDPLQ